jgi:hypothetical protein
MSKLVQLDLNPDDRTLRQFGLIAVVGFGLLAACAYYETWMFAFGLGDARLPVAGTLAGVGVLSLLLGLVYPRANRVIFVGTAILAYPIGFVLSYVIMGVLFFLIIAPIGVLLRILGKTPLARSYDRNAATYWSKAHPSRGQQSYFRQF